MTHSEDAVEGLAAVGKAVAEGAAAHGNSLDALSDDKWVPTEADLRAGRELVAQAMTEPSSAAGPTPEQAKANADAAFAVGALCGALGGVGREVLATKIQRRFEEVIAEQELAE